MVMGLELTGTDFFLIAPLLAPVFVDAVAEEEAVAIASGLPLAVAEE